MSVATTAALIARRRRVVVVAATLLLRKGGQQGPQAAKRKDKSPFIWSDHVDRLTEAEFKLRYRLSAEAFYELLGKIENDLSPI